jgi:membrane-associated protein
MEIIQHFIDIILHVDQHLEDFTQNYGTLVYVLLFLIIFCETGLVVCPFLPGDSLIFAAGAVAAMSNPINPILIFIIIFVAAVLGDTVNYHIGKNFGHIIIRRNLIKQAHLEKTHAFFEKHGGKTIVYARFVPIVRTLAPFVAGISKMSYKYFIKYNFFGGLLWTGGFLLLGYFFGNIEIVKKNFSLVVLAIIFLSLVPPIITYISSKFSKKDSNDSDNHTQEDKSNQ